MNPHIEKINGGKTKISLEKSTGASKTVVIFLPGVSGEAFTQKFNSLAQACLKTGMDFLRLQSWDDMEQLEKMNLAKLHEDIDVTVTYLKNQKYVNIYAIGKSLGGTALLTANNPGITRMVLWAPVIGLTESNSNLSDNIHKKFSRINSLREITTNKDECAHIQIPVLIIQGVQDDSMPVEESTKLAAILPKASIVKVQGMGHSYKTPEQEEFVLKETFQFLQQ